MFIYKHFIFVFLCAFAVTGLLVPVVRRLAVALDAVDYPGGRRVNKKPIPRLGGLAIFGGVLAGFLLEWFGERYGLWLGPFYDPITLAANVKLWGLLAGLAVIVLTGAVDDVVQLSARTKFFGMLGAALIIACTGTLLSSFKLPFTNSVVNLGDWPLLAYALTVGYLLCFMNIINLIDGLDGLAAGVTGIASASLFALTYGLGRYEASLAAAVLVGVCIAFLMYNFNPASIFMGVSGALLLGTMVGAISLLGAARFSSVTALGVPLIIAGVPLIDTVSAVIRRLRGRQPITVADAGHIHHRLLRAGFSQRKAVLAIYFWTACLCAGAGFIWNFGGSSKYLLLMCMLVVSAAITFKLGLLGPVLTHHYYPEDGEADGDDASE